MGRNALKPGYTENYYDDNGQAKDRPALLLYQRLAKHYFERGKVLDFGCGTGPMLRRLSKDFEAIGVESSDWAREQAKELTMRPVHSDMGEIEEGSLSGIVSIHVVEHIADANLVDVFSDWRRLLKERGRLLIVTPDAEGYAARQKKGQWIAFTDPTHINLKGAAEWRTLFQQSGFDIVKEGADGLWDFPYQYKMFGRAEVILKGWSTLAQFLSGKILLPSGAGESCLFILERR